MRTFVRALPIIALATCAQTKPQATEPNTPESPAGTVLAQTSKPTEDSKPTETSKPTEETPAIKENAPLVSNAKNAYVPIPQNEPLPRYNEKSPLGMNLVRVRDYFSETTFVDAMKRSRAWQSGGTNRGEFQDNRPIDVDENGWVKSLKPGQVARTLFFWGKGIKYPEGDYVVLYDGQGKLEYINGIVAEKKPGREVIQPNPSMGGFALAITHTVPSDPLRNIRVLMPGGVCQKDPYKTCRRSEDCGSGGAQCVPFERNYREQIFHPAFLNLIKDFSVLRFTDWMDTNERDHAKGDWKDRPKLTDARWTIKGVPVELIVDLANRISADAWINIPHLADDEYVRQFAGFFRDNLRSGLKVYVEHSNEVWNGGFEQAQYARRLSQEQKLSPNPAEAATMFHSRRSVQIFKIFEQVMHKERIVRVMGSFIAVPFMSEAALKFEDAYKFTDAIAIAPYFGVNSEGEALTHLPSMSVDEVLAELKGPQKERMGKWLDGHMAIAKKYKVKVIAYEGGDHLNTPPQFAQNEQLNATFDAVSRDPRIKDVYLDYLKQWKEKGGGLYMHFVSCAQPAVFGRFGAVEYLEQPIEKAPKLQALRAFIAANPRWW